MVLMTKKLIVGVCVVFFMVCFGPLISQVWAAGGDLQVKSFFVGTSGFLVKTVGSGVFLLGLISAGIKISAGDQGGLHTAIMVMIGGVIIFLAKPIVGVLMKWSGVS